MLDYDLFLRCVLFVRKPLESISAFAPCIEKSSDESFTFKLVLSFELLEWFMELIEIKLDNLTSNQRFTNNITLFERMKKSTFLLQVQLEKYYLYYYYLDSSNKFIAKTNNRNVYSNLLLITKSRFSISYHLGRAIFK